MSARKKTQNLLTTTTSGKSYPRNKSSSHCAAEMYLLSEEVSPLWTTYQCPLIQHCQQRDDKPSDKPSKKTEYSQRERLLPANLPQSRHGGSED
jgi:hypothetical protein